jgi:hypothetical protein
MGSRTARPSHRCPTLGISKFAGEQAQDPGGEHQLGGDPGKELGMLLEGAAVDAPAGPSRLRWPPVRRLAAEGSNIDGFPSNRSDTGTER